MLKNPKIKVLIGKKSVLFMSNRTLPENYRETLKDYTTVFSAMLKPENRPEVKITRVRKCRIVGIQP